MLSSLSIQEKPKGRWQTKWLVLSGLLAAVAIWSVIRFFPLRPRLWTVAHPATAFAYSPDGRTLAVGNQVNITVTTSQGRWAYAAGELQFRDAHTGVIQRTVPFLHRAVTEEDDEINGGPIGDIRWSADGKFLMASNLNAGDGDTIGVLEVTSGRWLFERRGKYEPHRQVFRPVGFLPGSDEAVYLETTVPIPAQAYSDDPAVFRHGVRTSHLVICDLHTGKTLRQFTSVIGSGEWPVQQALLPNSKQVALTIRMGQDGMGWFSHGSLIFIDAVNGQRRVIYVAKSDIDDFDSLMSFSEDGRFLLLNTTGGRVMLRDANTGQVRQLFQNTNTLVWRAALSPSGNILAGRTFDGSVYLWNAQTGGYLHRLQVKSQWTGNLTFSPDGHTLVGSDDKKTILLWHVN